MAENLNEYIDHTLLKPDICEEDVKRLCEQATAHHFAAVCVPPYFVKLSHTILRNTEVGLATVVGFPNGYDHIGTKVDAIKRCIDLGADELDVVINISAIKSERWQDVESEIDSLVTACKMKGKKIKLIIEAALLSESELAQLLPIISAAVPHFVKTSTGYHVPKDQLSLIQHLRENLPDTIKLKASGGIKTPEMAKALILAGSDRLGTSSAMKLIGVE
ncbi:MAG: deoxyribose-phosphate aldolase [Saprospirales bacterium]|nr:MAG: deoxyribose-phosphate aldolase [Saprospirales bacterium]